MKFGLNKEPIKYSNNFVTDKQNRIKDIVKCFPF